MTGQVLVVDGGDMIQEPHGIDLYGVARTRGGPNGLLEPHAWSHVVGRGGVTEVGGDAERLFGGAKHGIVGVEGGVRFGMDSCGDGDRDNVARLVGVRRVGALLAGSAALAFVEGDDDQRASGLIVAGRLDRLDGSVFGVMKVKAAVGSVVAPASEPAIGTSNSLHALAIGVYQ